MTAPQAPNGGQSPHSPARAAEERARSLNHVRSQAIRLQTAVMSQLPCCTYDQSVYQHTRACTTQLYPSIQIRSVRRRRWVIDLPPAAQRPALIVDGAWTHHTTRGPQANDSQDR